MNRAQAERLLQRAVGNPDTGFRDGQWEAIDGLANRRRRLLVVQRTGWGKSSVYFLSTRILRNQGHGPTVIVSPLLALMRNQIEAAERLGIRAATINSTNREHWQGIVQSLHDDTVDAVLISPERLANESFDDTVMRHLVSRLGLLVVDEAHCISDWGHDFRQDYRRITGVLARLPADTPILATTATANDRVVDDIQRQLGGVEILRGPLARDSLRLQTLRLPDQAARLAWLARWIPRLPGSGIVYTLTRRDADQVSGWLRRHRIEAWPYYSNASHPKIPDPVQYRERLEAGLLANKVKVVVATSALGMGFDKPDLGFVVHYQAPANLVAYYQQVGRAGRAIPEARGVLLSGREDGHIHEYFWRSALPDEAEIHRLLELLAASSSGLSVNQLQDRLNLSRGQIDLVLNFLKLENPPPIVKSGSRWQRTDAPFSPDPAHLEFLLRRKADEWAEVQRYLDTTDCLMAFLRRALDDPQAQPCGRCAHCDPDHRLACESGESVDTTARAFLQQGEQLIEPRLKLPGKGLFTIHRLPHDLRGAGLSAEPGRSLCRWDDAGWGRQVAGDSQQGRIGEALVEATVEMIQQRWQPRPAPSWLTWVPSPERPLVADFAERLAACLDLPCRQVIIKRRANQPQRQMRNSHQQCRNLDGVFEIQTPLDTGPVLLVDDWMDSRWTLAVVTALLRQAGSGPVFPVVLASRAMG